MSQIPTPHDRVLARTVGNQTRMIEEHLEAMQRDSHGLEYARWKLEVDDMWKSVFGHINDMREDLQKSLLDHFWFGYSLMNHRQKQHFPVVRLY